MKSMKRASTNEITAKQHGKIVLLKGWIHELRDLAKIKFLQLRDSSGIIQCITKDKKLFKNFSKLTLESAIELQGKAKKAEIKSPVAIKGIEIEISSIKVLSKAAELPILVNEKTITTGLGKRLDYRCLDLRKPRNLALFKIQAALIEGMQQELEKQGFLQVFTPCLMGMGSESGAEVFKVKYYNKEAFLRQDPQLHRQLTILGGLEKIYDLGPNWRAELSHTTKHLTEHRCIAPELAFIKDEQDTRIIQEDVIIAAIKNIQKKCKQELRQFNLELKVPKKPFPELRFPDVYKIIEKAGKKFKKDQDFDAESEDIIWQHIKKKYKTDFYFINKFPFKIKPFYVYHDGEFANSIDLYGKGIELSSGGQREHRYNMLMKNLKEKKLNAKKLEWFTKFFKYGAPPHGGFAIGIERLTQAILNVANIKETCLFPRDPERVSP